MGHAINIWCQVWTFSWKHINCYRCVSDFRNWIKYWFIYYYFVCCSLIVKISLRSKCLHYSFLKMTCHFRKCADIAPLLEVEDMVRMKNPDWKCVFTYVQSIYRRFALPHPPLPIQHLITPEQDSDWIPIQGHASTWNHILVSRFSVLHCKQSSGDRTVCWIVSVFEGFRKKIIILSKRAFKFWANTRFRLLPLRYVSEFTWIWIFSLFNHFWPQKPDFIVWKNCFCSLVYVVQDHF